MSFHRFLENKVITGRVARRRGHSLSIALLLLAMLGIAATVQAQTLTISSDGDTGTSGTHWNLAGGMLTLTGTATVQASVIQTALAAGDLTIVGNPLFVNVNEAILSTTANRKLTFRAEGGASPTLQIKSTLTPAISVAGPIELAGSNVSLTTTNLETTHSSANVTINASANSAASSGNVALHTGTTITFNNGGFKTYSGVISGGGNLRKEGAGLLTLAGANTYTGTTTVFAATVSPNVIIEVGSGGSLGTGNVVLDGTTNTVGISTAFIAFNRSDDLTVDNLITGSGFFAKKGSGTLTLTQNNTYMGPTLVNEGTLVLKNDAPNPSNKTFGVEFTFPGGPLRIEPASDSFASTFSTVGWDFSRMQGLTIGTPSNSSDIVLGRRLDVGANNSTEVEGDIVVYGGQVTFANQVTTDNQTNGALTIHTDKPIQVANPFPAGSQLGQIDGVLTIVPRTGSFDADVAYPIAGYNYAIKGLVIGNETNTADIKIGRAVSGPITLFGGNITIGPTTSGGGVSNFNEPLIAGSGNSPMRIHATGAVTQTAGLQASDLVLHGPVAFMLDSATNRVQRIAGGTAASPLGSLTFLDQNVRAGDGLEIGAVGDLTGIFSTGPVFIETIVSLPATQSSTDLRLSATTANITLAADILTADVSDSAVVLNAGRTSALGQGTGGNILVSGDRAITTGQGGVVRLYSGSDAASTGLTDLVGDRSNVRSGVITTVFDPPLSSGSYAIYRLSSFSTGANGSLLSGTDLTRVADDDEAATITVQLRKDSGDDVTEAGESVAFFTTLGTLSAASATTDESGLATVFLTSDEVGSASVTASIGGSPVVNGSPVIVTFTAGAPATLLSDAGANQTAVAGQAVEIQPSVRVQDANEKPVAGVAVSFAVTVGGGSIAPETAVLTGTDGIAALTNWTLGTTAGANGLSATVAGLEPVSFSATGVAGPAAELELMDAANSDNQSADLGQAVAIPPSVRVLDANGNPVSGVSVTFAVLSGDGAVDPTSVILTDVDGIASVVSWTLGPSFGVNELTASVAGLGSVTFTAMGIDQVARQAILDYASGASNDAPTAAMFSDAGIQRINPDYIDAYNDALRVIGGNNQALDFDDIQRMVDGFNAVLDTRDNAPNITAPTLADYAALGVQVNLSDPIDPFVLELLNYGVANGSSAGEELETVAELQALADAAESIAGYAQEPDTAGAPGTTEFQSLGFDIDLDRINSYNSAIAEKGPDSVIAIEAIIAAFDKLLNGDALLLAEYARLGVIVVPSALDLLNDAVGNQPSQAVDTTPELQAMADAAARIIDAAVNPGNLNPPTAQDFAVLGINGVSGSNLAAVIDLIAAADPSLLNTVVGVLDVIAEALFDPAAVNALLNYADGAVGAVEPTLQTYQDAGISDVIEDQVPAYNSFLLVVEPEDRDEIQAIVDAYNAILDATGDMIKAADLDEALFDTLAIALLPGALDFLQAIIGGADADDVDTHAKLQGLADIANRLWAYASGVVDAELPVLGDYQAIGTQRLIGGNVGAYNSAIRAIEAKTPAEVQMVVDLYNSILDAANGNSATKPGLDVDDYANLEVVVDPSALALFEDAIGGQMANAVNTIEKLQQMADAAARIIDAAVNPGNLNPPTAQDFAVLGINGVNDGNLSDVITILGDAGLSEVVTVQGLLELLGGVLVSPLPVPTLSFWALCLMALLLVTLGMTQSHSAVIRRR